MTANQEDMQAAFSETKAASQPGVAVGALAKGYKIVIGSIIAEAWQRTKGNKGEVWLAAFLYIVAAFSINFTVGLAVNYLSFGPQNTTHALKFNLLIYELLIIIATTPLYAGMLMIGVKLARDEEVFATEIFAYYNKTLPLAIGVALVHILCVIGLILLVLPGVYLIFAYMMTIPLIADRKIKVWDALETSRKYISRHWFAFFGFILFLSLFFVVGAMLLFIGLIWTFPVIVIAFGILYRDMFGDSYNGRLEKVS